MPAKSQAQRGHLAATKGPKWMKEHGYDNKGKLPYKVGKKAGKKPAAKRNAAKKKRT